MRKILIIILLFLNVLTLYSQEDNDTDFQRNRIIREDIELTVESQFKYWFQNIAEATMYILNPNLSLEFIFLKYHSIKANFGYTISLYDDLFSRNNVFYSPNDINISYEYLYQIRNLNLYFGPQINIPLSLNNEYISREGVLSAGTGRVITGLTFAIIGIRDPVVWNFGFSYNIGMPKEERFGTSFLPGIMRFNIGLSDLLNDRLGFSFGFQQDITLPEIRDGSPLPNSLSLSNYVHGEIFALFEKDYIRLAVSFPTFPLGQPFIYTITYGHNFKIKTK